MVCWLYTKHYQKCYSSVAKVRPIFFKNGPAWTTKIYRYAAGGSDWRRGVGLARADGGGRFRSEMTSRRKLIVY